MTTDRNSENLFFVLGEWWERRPNNKLDKKTSLAKRWLPTPGNTLFTVMFTLAAVIGLLWAQSAGALPLAAPSGTSTGTIAYQGRLADTAGQPLTGTYNMTFRLYAAASGGAPLWEETWTGPNSVQVSDGLFNVMLGSLSAIPQAVVAGNASLFLGITVGTDSEMSPRVQLGSVPFAVQALTVPDGSITKAKLADGAVDSRALADGSVDSADIALESWGIAARIQGIIVMPESAVSDDGAGNISWTSTLIVMNPLSGSFIRVAPGTYHLDPWGYLYIDLPPTASAISQVTPRVGVWQQGTRRFDGKDHFLLAQRMSSGKVWFRFGWQTP